VSELAIDESTDSASVRPAVRETSVLIVAVLASRALDEQVDRARLAGAALVVGGVSLIVL